MDGNPTTQRLSFLLRPLRYGGAIALCLLAGHALAETPPTLQVQGEPQPIFHPSRAQAQIVRPSARVLKADALPSSSPTRSIDPSPTILRTKAQVAEFAPAGESNAPAHTAAPKSLVIQRHRTVDESLETRGSVTFRKTPLSEVVFMLSDLWHINIVAGENVSGEVSGTFHDAPLREVLSAALTAGGYGYRKMGNSLIVLPADQVGSDDPSFVTETIRIPLSLQNDESALQAAQLLLSERGKLQKIGEAGMLVMDTSPRVQRIRQLFQDLGRNDQPATGSAIPITPETITQSGIAYFSPQYTSAEEMAEPLQSALGDQVVVAAYPSENRIMIKGNANDLRLASEAVRQLDRPRPQVRITAMIYDVGLGELEQLGINWGRDLRVNANAQNEALENLTSEVSELFQFNSDLTGTGATSLGIATFKDTFAAAAILQALNNTSEAKLLADPSITVGDRRQASIRIVRRIPIVGANPVEGSNAVFTQTEFEEAGVILQVLPRISQDGTIELQVQPEYSVVAELTANGPVIDSRTADTTVRVANGQTFVLGGLRQKSIVESVRGIPYLKDVKYVGKLFQSHSTDVRESELIVFLKPEIIDTCHMGTPRETQAAIVAERQLDRIPHAEETPMTPYCNDPYCPNHHPRPRINAGTQSLELGGQYYQHSVEFEEAPEIEVVVPPQAALKPVEPSFRKTGHVINDVFPPLHIDPRVLDK